MRSLLIILALSMSLMAWSSSQLEVQKYVFNSGKAVNYEYTLTAIAEIESQYGKYMVNLADPSCGILHIMPKSLIKRTELNDNSWNHSRLCERLIIDKEFSISAAILELKYWENYWTSKGVQRIWSHTVASYNGGFKADPNGAYIKKVRKVIRNLKKTLKE